MENPCENCRETNLVHDLETSNMVCASCGIVQASYNYEARRNHGTDIRFGKSTSDSLCNYKQINILKAHKLIDEFVSRLGLSGTRSSHVKLLIDKFTHGEYRHRQAAGKRFPILVGACIYVVMRRDKRELPIAQVADLVCCDEYELCRMIDRVVNFIDSKLPEFDIAYTLECAIKRCPSFARVSESRFQRMLEQGVLLSRCLIKRKPMPVVVAILVFVAELNQVHVKIEDVANELHSAVRTCRLRYKELVEKLVEVAALVLPWGEDVTVKNILKNAPSVIQYMEMKSMTKSKSGQRVRAFSG